jgi:predicted kinase
MPTLYLTRGLPGSAKATIAKRLEQQAYALRLTGDELGRYDVALSIEDLGCWTPV